MLCDVCDSLDLAVDDFIVGRTDRGTFYDDYRNIGTVYDIQQRCISCPLCRLVLEAIGVGRGDRLQATQCQLYWQGEGFVKCSDEPQVRFLRVSASPWPPSCNEFHRICLFGDDAPRGLSRRFLGRRVPDKVAIPVIKRWISTCEDWHDEHCTTTISQPRRSLPDSFRVLDVWNQCITSELPYDFDYLALSYIWGQISCMTLTQERFAELMKPGSLKRMWQLIPRTIRDAITLTSCLGLRYLWVDSLCIIQDDPVDKMSLIPAMGLIYDRAFLTIIAAAGRDSTAGLPGLRKGTRCKSQRIEELKPGLRLTAPTHLGDALEKSHYETRGWTFQERILSRRRLFFFEDQVVFQCRSTTYREDIHLVDWRITACHDESGTRFLKGLVAADEPHNVYVGTLWEYSGRQLSVKSDVVDAFAGILDILTRRMAEPGNSDISQKSSTCGLPAAIFDWALLWGPVDRPQSRSDGLWPSWSWCGWEGQSSMLLTSLNMSELHEWLLHRTWIKWLVIEKQCESDGLHKWWIAHKGRQRFSALLDHHELATQLCDQDIDDEILHKISKSPAGVVLCFVTLSIKLTIQPTDATGQQQFEYQICTANRVPCGRVRLDIQWKHATNELHEFIAISEAKSKSLNTANERTIWDAYHVIMVQYEDANEFAQRIGLGIVLQDSMGADSGATWKKICLR